jgi:protocadherin-15
VSEGSPRHTSVITVNAKDPEEATVTYSIISGNNLEHFSIGESTGVIRVMQPLDREELRRYSLVNLTTCHDINSSMFVFQAIKAEDEGKKASTATVNIMVTDVNDQNPEFQNLPYSFRVKEGEIDAFVGRVFAEDKDVAENANISYSVPFESPFEIDNVSGKISTHCGLRMTLGQNVNI